jgi:hypothetical protein
LGKIPAEQRRRQLSELVEELRRLPEIPDCTALLPLVRHRWRRVRHAAIGSLAMCRTDPRAETALLGVLAGTSYDYDRIYANAVLSKCGTAAAIRDPSLPGATVLALVAASSSPWPGR